MRQLVVILVFMLVACGGAQQPQRQIPVVRSALAQSNSYSIKDFAGLSTPDEAVNLAFKVAGQIQRLPAVRGVEVARGELLAELDPRDFELQLMADRSSFEQAQSRLERTERLLEHQAVSRAEYEIALSEYTRLKSIYENAKDILTETSLRSPFKAIIERVYVDTYQRVTSGERVVRVVSPNSTTVEFTAPESSLFSLLDSATLFRVRFDAYPGAIFDATIKEYARTSSDASGFPVALTIKNIAGYAIQSGLSATITMMTPQDSISSVVVPLSAIYAPVQGGNYVWVISTDDMVKLHKVTLGEPTGRSSIVINGGIKAGSRVVTAGVYQLQEGDRVKIIEGL